MLSALVQISFLGLTFLSCLAQARDVVTQDPQTKITLSPTLPNGMMSVAIQLRFQELMRLSGLKSQVSDSKYQIVATNSDFSKTLFLKTDSRIDSAWLNKPLRDPKGIYLWTPVQSRQAALFFYGFQDQEVLEILEQYGKAYGLKDLILDRRPSSEIASAQSHQAPLSFAKAAVDLGESFLKCGLGYVEGFNSVFWDPFVMTGKSVAYAYHDRKQYWANTLREWETFKDSIRHFDRYVQEKYENYRALPPAEKSRLYCSFVGGGTGGATAGKLLKVAWLGERSSQIAATLEKAPKAPGRQLSMSGHSALKDLMNYFEEKAAAQQKRIEAGEIPGDQVNKGEHRIKVVKGRAHIKIGYLKKEKDGQFMKLLLRAYKEGAVAEIDAGLILGPKVLNLLNQLRKLTPLNGQLCEFRGGLNAANLLDEMQLQVQASTAGYRSQTSPKYWRQADIEDFNRALKELHFDEACLKFYQTNAISKCGFLKFKMNNKNPSQVEWNN